MKCRTCMETEVMLAIVVCNRSGAEYLGPAFFRGGPLRQERRWLCSENARSSTSHAARLTRVRVKKHAEHMSRKSLSLL